MIEHHREEVRARDLDQAAFLIARGISALVRRALDECPDRLYDPAFRESLLELLLRYVVEDT